MTVKELISESFLPVSKTDVVGDALSKAIYGEVKQLPVVDEDGRLVGMIRASTLLDEPDMSKPIGDLPFDAPVSVRENAHIYDAIQLVIERSIDVLPVVTEDGVYSGSVGLSNVLAPLSRMLALPEAGSILVVEMQLQDYTLKHVVHAVEENGARILSIVSDRSNRMEDTLTLTVKVSIEDTSRIRAVLEHLGYRVKGIAGREFDDEELQHRVAEFIHYLEV